MSLLGHDKRTVKSWEAAPEDMSLEATGKDGQWRCWRDVLRKSVPDTRGGDRKSSVTDGWQRRTADNQWRCRGGTQTTSSFGVCWLAEFVGEVRRCYTLPTLVDKESQLVVDPLRRLQPMQLTEEWGDVLVPRRGKQQPSSIIHHRLKPLQQVQRNAVSWVMTTLHKTMYTINHVTFSIVCQL